MRLWSLHPRYLDSKGLVAAWREGLLAQAVLRGQTAGYTRHPQLERFRAHATPVRCIATYLRTIHAEAMRRGYAFNISKLARGGAAGRLPVTRGQLDFEWEHLRRKIERRDAAWLAELHAGSGVGSAGAGTRVLANPSFRVVPGGIASWEKSDG